MHGSEKTGIPCMYVALRSKTVLQMFFVNFFYFFSAEIFPSMQLSPLPLEPSFPSFPAQALKSNAKT